MVNKKGQVEDIFADVDKQPSNQQTVKKGKIVSKNKAEKLPQVSSQAKAVPQTPTSIRLKGPIKVLVIFAVVMILGIVYIFISGIVGNDSSSPAISNTSTTGLSDESPVSINSNENINNDNKVVIPDIKEGPADKDGDGLTDDEEKTIGTSLIKSDTDGDGLFDREEVEVYKTNPKLKDTDSDGQDDGDEVLSGNNPNGSGLLLDLQESIDNL